MKTQNDIETFAKTMMACGADKKITTPSYAEFIELLINIFDLHTIGKKSTRPKEMTEARSMYKRQLAHQEALTKLLSVLNVKEEDRAFLRTSFLKIENILSYLKSITICTPQPAELGVITFLKLIALPQILEVLHYCDKERRIGFAFEMMHFLDLIVQKGKNESDCLLLLREGIGKQLKNHVCIDFRIELGKFDVRSFPTMKSIEKMLDILRCDVSISVKDEAEIDWIIAQVKFRLLGAKAAFKALKLLKGDGADRKLSISHGFMMLHRELCKRYVCNRDVSELDYDFIEDENFERIVNVFLKTIGDAEYEDLPAEVTNSLENLILSENHAFLPWCVYQRLICDLNNDIVDEAYLKHFEKAFLLTAKNHQYGQIAVTIASILLAMKIKNIANIPNQSLEPLTMVFMENGPIGNEISLHWETPFGKEERTLTYTSEFNIAKSIYNFNENLHLGWIHETLCNPLEELNEILHYIFQKIDENKNSDETFKIPNHIKEKRPVKTLNLSLYDALKTINRLIYQFGLIESVQDIRHGNNVKTSLSGDFINRYLALKPSKKIAILKIIDSEKCQADLDKMQSKL